MPWVVHFWAEFDLIYQTGSTPPTSGRYNVQTIVFSHGHAGFPVCFGSCCGVTVNQAGFPVLCQVVGPRCFCSNPSFGVHH